jgi:hypothetical protein
MFPATAASARLILPAQSNPGSFPIQHWSPDLSHALPSDLEEEPKAMHIQSRISVLALAAALAVAPLPALAQISLGINLGANASKSALGLDAGVDLGLGEHDLEVDAGIGVGGDSLVDVDVGVGAGSSSDDSTQLDVDAEVLGDDDLLDADVTLQSGQSTMRNQPVSRTDASGETVGIRVSALDESARLDILAGQVNNPDLLDVDLDAAIDDRRVAIVALADLLGIEDAAEIRILLDAGGKGRDDLIAALDASVELGAILDRHGLEPSDVVALSVDADGSAELIVAEIDLALADTGKAPLRDSDLAALDIDLLTEDELAEIDLALLPEEAQRLDAMVRILGRDNIAPATTPVEVVAVDALLGRSALAELDVLLDDGAGDDVVLTADLLDTLEEEGLSPEAVIGLGTSGTGPTRLFVNTGLGDGDGDRLAQAEITLGSPAGNAGDDGDDPAVDNGATGGIGNPPAPTPAAPPSSSGGPNAGNASDNGDTDGGSDSDMDTADGSAGTPAADGNAGPAAAPATSAAVQQVAPRTIGAPVEARFLEPLAVAELGCVAGLGALASQSPPAPSAVDAAQSVSLISIVGCGATLQQDEVEALRAAVAASPDLSLAVDNAGLAVDDLIGGTFEDTALTLYFEADAAAAV